MNNEGQPYFRNSDVHRDIKAFLLKKTSIWTVENNRGY